MRIALALLSGLITSLAFPSWAFNSLDTRIGILAWVALVPLLHATSLVSRRRAFLLGWLAGFAFFASTLYWIACIREMEFMALPAWLACAAFLGLFWGVWGWGVSIAGGRAWLAGPALWVLLEWVRGHLFTGFPWAVLGTTQWAFQPVFLSARFTGVMGVSFGIVAVNIAVWKFQRREMFRVPAIVLAIFSMGALTILSYSARLSINSDTIGKPAVRMALLQGNFTEAEKWALPMEVMVERYVDLALQAGKSKAKVTLWPETATAGELSQDLVTSAKLAKLARNSRSVQVVGAILRENGHYYNAAYVVEANGVEAPFRKTHLVPFGEYIPGFVRAMLPFARKLTEGVTDYTPGESMNPGMTGPVRSGVQVCYESIFPDIARYQSRQGAEVFINLTNDAWYLRTAATYQHALGPIARSVECGRWMVRCANTGLSFFCSPAGHPHSTIALFETGFQAMDIVPVSRITPYARWGDIPLLILALLALALSYIPAERLAAPASSRQ